MNSWWRGGAVVVMLAVPAPGAAQEAPPPARDLGQQVRGIFAAKCAGCHGPELTRPKGRFGYVLDLRRVAENPEMVIPGRPDESELWLLVSRDEMPPADSRAGALAPAQKESIREWITAGAPPAGDSTAASEPHVPPPTATLSASRLFYWFGKFHLLLLHFPIALVLAANVGEAWSAWRRSKSQPSEAVQFCLRLAALAAVPTALLGWIFAAAGNGSASPSLLMAHRWLGTAAAVLIVLTAVSAETDVRRGTRSRRVRLLLAGAALVTALTGHFGGMLARGEDFLRF